MANSIKVIKSGLDVSKVIEQLEEYSDDWGNQRRIDDVESLLDRGYDDVDIGNLQLIMGKVKNKEDFVGDSEINIPTSAYGRHDEILRIFEKEFPGRPIHRCGFLRLPIDGYVALTLMREPTTIQEIGIIFQYVADISILLEMRL